MKQLLNFFPIIIFFIFYKQYDIYLASGAMIAASALVLIFTYVTYKKYRIIEIINFTIVLIFSTLTLVLHNDLFIKWKVTIIYTLLSFILLITQFILKKPLVQIILDKEIVLPKKTWNNLNLSWSVFFLMCGLTNIYVAFWLPQSTWVNFKVFILTALTLLLTFISSIYIYFIHKKISIFNSKTSQ